MVAENIAFGIVAAAMAVGAIGVVRTQNVVHAALLLVVVLAGAAALFGIMLTRAPMHPTETMDNNLRLWALLPAGLLAIVLGGLLIDAFGDNKIKLDAPTPNEAITNSIFRVYLVPFEVVGVLLLAALIGAVVLARKD